MSYLRASHAGYGGAIQNLGISYRYFNVAGRRNIFNIRDKIIQSKPKIAAFDRFHFRSQAYGHGLYHKRKYQEFFGKHLLRAGYDVYLQNRVGNRIESNRAAAAERFNRAKERYEIY